MSRAAATERWRPGRLEELMLRAAVLSGPAAHDAWREWRGQCRVSDADAGSYRLLPQIYRNLLAAEADDPDLERVKGVYRHAWSSNQLLYHRAAAGVAALQAKGLETMLLKGAAVNISYQRDVALRPMTDVDVLVRHPRAADAIDALIGNGWHPEHVDVRDRLRCRHSEPFVHDNGGALDLHWFSLFQPAPDEGLWERSRTADFAELRVQVPDPADLLLITCVHGACWNPVPSQRWVADAFAILGAGGVDWDLFVAEARRRRLTLNAHQALGYLHSRLGAPVPETALRDLRQTSRRRHERVAYWASARPCPPHDVARVQWDRYRRTTALVEHRRPGPVDFLRYAASGLGVEQPWRLPLRAARSLYTHGLRAPLPAG
jgi:Uncharacterised nucleotidyltransferase